MQITAKNIDKTAIVHWIVDVDVVRKLALVGHMDRDQDRDHDQDQDRDQDQDQDQDRDHDQDQDQDQSWQFPDAPAF